MDYTTPLNLNRRGIVLVNDGQAGAALPLLKDALRHTARLPPTSATLALQATTLNNLGCAYKRKNEPQLALKYLREACRLEAANANGPSELAGAFINLGVSYSDAGEHRQALRAGLKALDLLAGAKTAGQVTSYVICTHNVAVEYEYLVKPSLALQYYTKSYETAAECLGQQHPLTLALAQAKTEAEPVMRFNITRRVKTRRKRGSFAARPLDFARPRMQASSRSCIYSRDQLRKNFNKSQETVAGLESMAGLVQRPRTASIHVVRSSKQVF